MTTMDYWAAESLYAIKMGKNSTCKSVTVYIFSLIKREEDTVINVSYSHEYKPQVESYHIFWLGCSNVWEYVFSSTMTHVLCKSD